MLSINFVHAMQVYFMQWFNKKNVNFGWSVCPEARIVGMERGYRVECKEVVAIIRCSYLYYFVFKSVKNDIHDFQCCFSI